MNMKSLRVIVIAIVAGAAVPILAGGAYAAVGLPAGTSAAQCVRGCSMQKKECIQTARTTALACKLDCRTNTAPTALGACMKGCSSTFRGTKDTCRADQKTCIAGCTSGTPIGGTTAVDAACLSSCGTDLAACAGGVIATAKTCLGGCRTAPDRLSCLQGCGAAAETGGQTCATEFETCGTSCPPATP